ncbi:hypothetical protein [Blastococcus sp. CT_GayMR16]|uniref:hypothetical protein n=1 Tax=Blastococcus sp. CT_GayMR16 TaxID=2559607 RepID=UPI001072EDE2|nr:hypothetical protein [Blastococcus sp. CT_GayMR16]TFV90604.1 hypothetical protein E4P38_04105 [Blastococcus sp. CT_GayMR16]
MSPLKLSLFGGGDDREETVELDDDELVGKLREVVDAHPDLTLTEALRQGLQHVVDNGPTTKG